MPQTSIQQALQLAVRHHEANRLGEAEKIYLQVLASQPNHPVAQYFLARVLGERGQLADAVELLRRNVAAHPHVAEPRIALGEYLRLLGQVDQSIAALTRAAQIAPGNPHIYNGLGNSLRQAGRVEEAAGAFRRAIDLKPDFAEPHSNLGNALRVLGRYDESIAAHRQATRLKPQSPEVHNNFGLALKEKEELDEAISEFSRAIELRPDYVEALTNLGTVLAMRRRLDDALAAFTKSAVMRPDWPEVQNNLGNVLKEKGRLDESAAAFTRAIQLRPDFADAFSNLGINLSSQGKLDEAIAAFRRAIDLRPESSHYFGNLLYMLYFHPGYNAQAILREHVEWARRHARPLAKSDAPHRNDRSPQRRLRIGYVSPHFRDHCQSFFTVPLLSHHDHGRFEILCYSNVINVDEITERIRGYADVWRDIVGLNDEQAAELVRRDGIDILVDLTMHMERNRIMIFARKPAPVQVTWLAYPGTTGLQTIDYRLSDPYLDPGFDDAFYSEQTHRLPASFWCYDPLTSEPDVSELPSLSKGHFTFGCLNNLSKVTDGAIGMWAEVLQAVPGSHVQLLVPEGSARTRVNDLMQRHGIDADRIEFLGWQPRQDYLRQYHQIDLCLDPYPCPGHTTTMDGLWMGVPVVNLPGATAIARGAVSILTNVGIPEFLARDRDHYVQIARDFAGDLPRLSQLRAGLRERMTRSPLMDAKRFAADVEEAFRQMWKNWCNTV